MAEDISAVLLKVKKLLALSTSSNPNEAASAAAKAQALLMQYNLSVSQVDMQEKPPAYEKVTIETGSRVWRRHLLTAIAENNFCALVYLSGHACCILIGQVHNQDVVRQMYHSLVAQLEPMARAAYDQSGSTQHAKSWMDSFYMGAVESIWTRLRAHKQQMAAESEACRALVVVKDAELQAAVHWFFPHLSKGAAKRTRSAGGYHQGREAGNRITLHQALPRSS